MALLLVLLVVGGLYVQHALAYVSAREQWSAQRQVVRKLSRDNAQLVRQQQQLRDPATIILDARRLGMAWPGERPYVVMGLPGQ